MSQIRPPGPTPNVHLNQFGIAIGSLVLKNRLFFFAAYQGERFITSSPGEILTESPQLRQAVAETFPTSVANLLHSKFRPSTTGPRLPPQSRFVGGRFSGSGFARFGDSSVPCRDGWIGRDLEPVCQPFGVEQADIDQLNMPDDVPVPGGSPTHSAARCIESGDAPLLVNVLNTSPAHPPVRRPRATKVPCDLH